MWTAAIAFTLAQALSAPPCGPTDQFLEQLAIQYGELPVGAGIAVNPNQSSSNMLVMVTRNQETGTWSLLFVYPHGRTCIMQAGEGWEDSYRKIGEPT